MWMREKTMGEKVGSLNSPVNVKWVLVFQTFMFWAVSKLSMSTKIKFIFTNKSIHYRWQVVMA